jgi:hypothetical protein
VAVVVLAATAVVWQRMGNMNFVFEEKNKKKKKNCCRTKAFLSAMTTTTSV